MAFDEDKKWVLYTAGNDRRMGLFLGKAKESTTRYLMFTGPATESDGTRDGRMGMRKKDGKGRKPGWAFGGAPAVPVTRDPVTWEQLKLTLACA